MLAFIVYVYCTLYRFRVRVLHSGEKMYRQYLHERQVEGEWFVSRMCELPMVNSAVEQLTALYSGVKQHNRVFRFTLDTAEGGMHMVYQTASPVLSKFDKPSKILKYIRGLVHLSILTVHVL